MKVPHAQRFELTLDLFKGCRHSCSGCMVDKVIGSSLNNLPEILSLVDELIVSGFVPYDVSIGPTDISSSANVLEVTGNVTLRDIIARFNAFTVNAAFLEKKDQPYIDLAAIIDDVAGPNKPVRILIPAAPAYFKSAKFGKHISNRLDIVAANLKVSKLEEAGFVINCTTETLYEGFESQLTQGLDLTFNVEKDDILNISYGRSNNKDILLSNKVLNVSREIFKFYQNLDSDEVRHTAPDLCYQTGLLLNLLYVGDRLYWMPFLKDETAFIDQAFEISKPWTMANVLAARDRSISSSIDYVKDLKCSDCEMLGSCSGKGVTTLMSALSITECLVGLK